MSKPRGLPPRLVKYRGETVPLKQLAKDHGMNARTLSSRLERGWSVEKALSEPVQHGSTNKRGVIPVDKRGFGTRTKIINTLMETFFKNPKRFERWVEGEMDRDYGEFYKTFVMPFLPKDTNALLDKTQEKAVINIQFNANGKADPPTFDVT